MPAVLKMTVSFDRAVLRDALVRGKQTLAAQVTAGMSRAGERAKQVLRAEVDRAGLGAKLRNAVRAEVYPKQGPSLRPALFVFGRSALLDYFDDGGTVQGKGWLLIPTEEAERLGYAETDADRFGGRVPANQLRRLARPDLARRDFDLHFRPAKNGNLLVLGTPKRERRGRIAERRARRGAASAPLLDAQPVALFVAVKAATIPKLLDFAAQRATVQGFVVDEINRAVQTDLAR